LGEFIGDGFTPPRITAPYNDFESFRTFVIENMKNQDLSMEQKADFVNNHFKDPNLCEKVNAPGGVIERFKLGFAKWIKYENPPKYR